MPGLVDGQMVEVYWQVLQVVGVAFATGLAFRGLW